MSVSFSESINPASFSLGTFQLQVGAQTIAGMLSANGSSATIAPADRLSPLTTYTATLSSAITDLAGNHLASPVTWSFTTADRTWDSAKRLAGNGSSYPQIVLALNGDAVVFWDDIQHIFMSRYTASTGVWSTPIVVSGNNSGALDPRAAVDPSGNIMVVWWGFDSRIWSNRYRATTGQWGTPVRIDSLTGSPSGPQVGIDKNGNAIAVWLRGAPNEPYGAWANRYDAATDAWGVAQKINVNSLSADYPVIAVDEDGNAIAAWSDGVSSAIFANRYSAASGSWGSGVILSGSATGVAATPQIAFSPNGDAFVVWDQPDGVRYNVWGQRYVSATNSWQAASMIEADDEDSYSPRIGIDSSGNAMAVWEQFDGTRSNIVANRYTAASNSWGTPQLVENNNQRSAQFPFLNVSKNGDAHVVWMMATSGPGFGVWSNRYSAATNTWGTELPLRDGVDTNVPQVIVDDTGDAISVWTEFDGIFWGVSASRYE